VQEEVIAQLIAQLHAALPPIFLGSASDELTGGAINWGTVQNKRSRGEIPDECFVRAGPRVLVVRDPFLSWWGSTLRPARATSKSFEPPRPRAGQRRRKQEVASAAARISE
jgi:hypothetical protein